MNQLQEGYDEMSGFQSCDLLMSQLPWRVFHLKIIYSTVSQPLRVLANYTSMLARTAKYIAFNVFYFESFPFGEKAFGCPLPSRNGCAAASQVSDSVDENNRPWEMVASSWTRVGDAKADGSIFLTLASN